MQETYTELLTQIVADLQQARNSLRKEGTTAAAATADPDELYRLWFNYKNKLEVHTNPGYGFTGSIGPFASTGSLTPNTDR